MFNFRSSKSELTTRHDDSIDASPSHKKGSSDSTETVTEERKLEDKIMSLYHVAWLGIYQVHDKDGQSHVSRLAKLFFGAGMTSYVDSSEVEPSCHHDCRQGRYKTGAECRVLDPLWTTLSKQGLASLKLFTGLSVASLEAVIELLEAYVKEVANVNALYQMLRELQVGFRTPTQDDQQAVLDKFVPAMNDLSRRLLHLDARLNVLVLDLEDEFWNANGPVKGREGWRVHDALYPRYSGRGKRMGLTSSMNID